MEETAGPRDRIAGTLAAEFATNGELLGRWVLLAEVVDITGERAMWTLSAEEQKPWETLGLIRLADHIEAAAVVKDATD